jgi:hypothetical protein
MDWSGALGRKAVVDRRRPRSGRPLRGICAGHGAPLPVRLLGAPGE